MVSDSVASRCMVVQPSRDVTVEQYGDLRHTYKVIDYGNPRLSLYGIIIIISYCTTEVIESINFDNLNDFRIVGEEPGTTTFSHELLI